MSSSSPVAALPDRPVVALPRRVSWAEQALMIFAKDVAIELRTGEVVTTSAFFGFYLWGLDLLFTQLMKQIMGSR